MNVKSLSLVLEMVRLVVFTICASLLLKQKIEKQFEIICLKKKLYNLYKNQNQILKIMAHLDTSFYYITFEI